MKKLISECLSQDSFTRLSHKILIRNETSHTQFVKPDLITIRELKENGIVLEMPINICQKGHGLTLFFLTSETIPKHKLPEKGPYRDSLMEALSKVEKVEVSSNHKDVVIVDLNFTQHDGKLWKSILEQYDLNQEKIDQMMKLRMLSARRNT